MHTALNWKIVNVIQGERRGKLSQHKLKIKNEKQISRFYAMYRRAIKIRSTKNEKMMNTLTARLKISLFCFPIQGS